jgi:glycosyltransferase involved in cell wall biosynthesis
MFKVVAVVDKKGSAIDRLAHGLTPYFDNLNYSVVDAHPKRPDREQLANFANAALDADIIDFQYWKTAEMLRNVFPWIAAKKTILAHHNPYNVKESDWANYTAIVANNKAIYTELGNSAAAPVELIPNTVDADFWQYNPDWQPSNTVLMVAARIEAKKGILPVAKACAKLGLNFHLVGTVSDAAYFKDIASLRGVTFYDTIPDADLRRLYYGACVVVCNSVDGYESGPLPILEAMHCGTPVLSRMVGSVVDIYNGDNMVIHGGMPDDVQGIADILEHMLIDKQALHTMRDMAWQSIKGRTNQRRAWQYMQLYYKVGFAIAPYNKDISTNISMTSSQYDDVHTHDIGLTSRQGGGVITNRPLADPGIPPHLNPPPIPTPLTSLTVSAIVPIHRDPATIRKCLTALASQTYPALELIVCDDSLGGKHEALVRDLAKYISLPIRYLKTAQVLLDPEPHKDYGLARARNIGTEWAAGDLVVYCDERQVMAPDCIEQFVKYAKPRYWLFGNKGGNKKEFVENLSCVYRRDVITAGLFNERITEYGGMSQELRHRIRNQGLKTEYVESARATPAGKSSNRNRKRLEIIHMKDLLYRMGLDK